MEDRKKLIKMVRKLGFKGKILTPTEHRKLVQGKKIVFSKQATEDIKRLNEESD